MSAILTAKTAADVVTGIELLQELLAAATKLSTLPGFGTTAGIAPADLAALRLGEGVEQAKLAAVIAAMPDGEGSAI